MDDARQDGSALELPGTEERRGRVTEILELSVDAARDDGVEPTRELMPYVYEELRLLARHHLAREKGPTTLQPTALVHEAYLRLLGQDASWANRAHFFGAAGQAMRRILVDHARDRSAVKRGGGHARVDLEDLTLGTLPRSIDLLALDEALGELAVDDRRLATVVDLRYFAGLSTEETARALDVSERTVVRDWRCARAWLVERLQRGETRHEATPQRGGSSPEEGVG